MKGEKMKCLECGTRSMEIVCPICGVESIREYIPPQIYGVLDGLNLLDNPPLSWIVFPNGKNVPFFKTGHIDKSDGGI